MKLIPVHLRSRVRGAQRWSRIRHVSGDSSSNSFSSDAFTPDPASDEVSDVNRKFWNDTVEGCTFKASASSVIDKVQSQRTLLVRISWCGLPLLWRAAIELRFVTPRM